MTKSSRQQAAGSRQQRTAYAPAFCLLLSAFLTTALYVVFLALPYPLITFFDVPLLDLGKIADHEPAYAAALVVGFALIFALYLAGYRATRQIASLHPQFANRLLIFIIASSLLFTLVLLWVFPIGAIDLYDYIFRARLWGHYDYNPLTVTPLQVNDDAWFPYVVWIWFPSPYGPLWAHLSLALYRLAGDSLLTNLVLFKLLPAACIVVCARLSYDILQASGTARRLGGTLLFAWNPLLLFESVVNGHNDIVMMTFVLLALWLYQQRRFTPALVCCVLAACVKVAALVALPIMFVGIVKAVARPRDQSWGYKATPRVLCGAQIARHARALRGCDTGREQGLGSPTDRVLICSVAAAKRCFSIARRAVNTTMPLRFCLTRFAICLAVVAVLYAPLWRSGDALAGLSALDNRFTSSLAAIVKLSLEAWMGREPAEAWTRALFGMAFVLLYGWRLVRVRSNVDGLCEDLCAAFVLLLIVGTLWFEPWYVVWVVTFAPFVKPAWQRFIVRWSASAMCTYLIFDFAWYWWPDFLNAANVLVLNVVVVALWLGPLVFRPDKFRTLRRAASPPRA